MSYSVDLILHQSNNNTSQGTALLEELTLGQRFLRALKYSSIAFIISLALVAVPVLHFFLVPAGLLISIWIFASTFKTTTLLLSGKGSCPSCQQEFIIHPRSKDFPFEDVCQQCGRKTQVALANPDTLKAA